MACCENCGKEFLQKRSDARFCSTKCRVAAHRRAEKVNQMLPVMKKLSRLQKFAPGAASAASALILKHGFECSDDALKVALSAYKEGAKSRL